MSHTAAPGGSNQTLLSLLRHRPPETLCECVFLEDGPVREQAAAHGATVRLIPSGRARELWKAPGTLRALRGAIRETQADVVFAHVTKAHLYASPAARLEHAPYLWWQHERRSQKPLMHAISARLPAAAVICSSDLTAAQQRAWRGAAAVHRIHPGVEIDPLPAPHEHTAGAGDQIVIGVVGRLQRWKRIELVLRTMPRLLEAEPELSLRVVGGTTPGVDDGYGDELRQEARALGLGAAVQFLGQVPDARAEIAGLDVLVHTAEAEPFGLVLVEGMLAGVPVVAADEGGPREIVTPGVDGLLTAVDRDSLAASVLALARDPERRAEMGLAGRRAALERFTAARMAHETWTLVRAVQRRR